VFRSIAFLAATVAAMFAVALGLSQLLREARMRELVPGRAVSEEETELEISRSEPPPESAE